MCSFLVFKKQYTHERFFDLPVSIEVKEIHTPTSQFFVFL